jgi:lipopolysaccharide/colanic/teichoic acid biosynthesis glycosyltransferase
MPSMEIQIARPSSAGGFGEHLSWSSKRLIDVVGATLGLMLLAPLMFVIAVLVRLDSAGPVIFRQERMGRGGRHFWCLKFRSMTVDADRLLGELEGRNESVDGVMFQMKHDPRVTGVGWFLRRWSLDELPQLWNVLKGEMSLIGPRPLSLHECRKLADLDPDRFGTRLAVLPGLTGLAQVSGRRDLSSNRTLELDRRYVREWSLGLDLAILARTFVVVLSREGVD